MVYIVMAYIVMAYIVMAYIVMAYIVMARRRTPRPRCRSEGRLKASLPVSSPMATVRFDPAPSAVRRRHYRYGILVMALRFDPAPSAVRRRHYSYGILVMALRFDPAPSAVRRRHAPERFTKQNKKRGRKIDPHSGRAPRSSGASSSPAYLLVMAH